MTQLVGFLQETHFKSKDTCKLGVKRWKKIFPANSNQRELEWPDKRDFKTNIVTRDKEGHCIIIKGSVH